MFFSGGPVVVSNCFCDIQYFLLVHLSHSVLNTIMEVHQLLQFYNGDTPSMDDQDIEHLYNPSRQKEQLQHHQSLDYVNWE